MEVVEIRNYTIFCKYFQLFREMKIRERSSNQKFTEDIGNTGEAFQSHIHTALQQCVLFHVDSDLKNLFMLTDTPKNNTGLRLPYDYLFLDVEFNKKELANMGYNIKRDTVVGFILCNGILVQGDKQKVVGKNIRITTFTLQNDMWFDTFNVLPEITDDSLKGYHLKVQTLDISDETVRELSIRFVFNFLNFMNSDDFKTIDIQPSASQNQRREREGKYKIPLTKRIVLSDHITRYIAKLKSSGQFHYNYSFWVRGHFRRLMSDRYKEKKRLWIMPYVKGEGILVQRNYDLRHTEKVESF